MNNKSPERIIESLNGKSESDKRRSTFIRRRIGAVLLAGTTLVAASPVIEHVAHEGTKIMDFATNHLNDLLHSNNVQNDFSAFNLANNPDELSKTLKHDGLTDKDVTVYTIKDSEFTNHDVAVDLHAKDAEKLAGMIESQLSDPVTKVEGDIQGRVVVVPNEMLNRE